MHKIAARRKVNNRLWRRGFSPLETRSLHARIAAVDEATMTEDRVPRIGIGAKSLAIAGRQTLPLRPAIPHNKHYSEMENQ